VSIRDKALGAPVRPEFRDFIGRLRALDKTLGDELERALQRGGFVDTVREYPKHPLDGALVTNITVDHGLLDLGYAMPSPIRVSMDFSFFEGFDMENLQNWLSTQRTSPVFST
jgi:hypothetical protein